MNRQGTISTPTVDLSEKLEQPPPIDDRRDRFIGLHERLILPEVGRCIPSEAPQEFVSTVERPPQMPEQRLD